jgi:hypothetical protein
MIPRSRKTADGSIECVMLTDKLKEIHALVGELSTRFADIEIAWQEVYATVILPSLVSAQRCIRGCPVMFADALRAAPQNRFDYALSAPPMRADTAGSIVLFL